MFKVICRILLVSALIFQIGCEIKDPVLPTWENKATVPLISANYTSIDLVSESDSSIKTDVSGNYYYSNTDTIKQVDLSDKLKLKNRIESGSTGLDTLKIDSFQTDEVSFSLGKINSELGNANGQQTVIPSFDFQVPSAPFKALSGFEYAILEPNQQLQIKITNTLGIDISNLKLTIEEISPSRIIVSKTLNSNIISGETVFENIDIGGKKLSNDMAISVTGSSSGSNNQSVLIDTSLSMKFEVISSELIISEAKAKISLSEFSIKDSTVIEQDRVIAKDVTLKSGTLKITINNESEISGSIVISSKELKTSAGGSSFTQTIPILAKQSGVPVIVPLENYFLDFPVKPAIYFNIKVKVGGSSQFITVKKTDQVKYFTEISDAVPKLVHGYFVESNEDSDPDTSDITYPNDLGDTDIFLDDGFAEATVSSGLGVPAQITPLIIFKYDHSADDTLQFSPGIFPQSIPAAPSVGQFATITKKINLTDMIGFNEKLNKRPKTILVMGKTKVAPGGYPNGFIDNNYTIKGTVKVNFPIRFKTNTGFKKEIVDDFPSDTFDHLESAQLNVQVQNGVPFRTAFRISFLNSKNDTVLTFPKKTEPNRFIEISQPEIDPEGKVISPLLQNLAPFNLSREELDILAKAKKTHVIFKLFTSNTDAGRFIQLNSSDQLKFTMFTTIGTRVNQ